MLDEGGDDGVTCGTDELGPVLCGPVSAGREALRSPLEGRHDIASDELIGALGRRSVGPLMTHEEVGPEPAGLRIEATKLRDGIVDGSDDRQAGIVEGLNERGGVGGVRSQGERGHPLEVVDPIGETEGHFLDRLFPRRGEVHGPDQTPPRSIDGGAELLGALLHHLPVGAQCIEAPC